MNNKRAKEIYRTLLLVCTLYFLLVAFAHQLGMKVPLLFIFYAVPSERYQDLIISFLSFGWAMLFGVGFLDRDLKAGIQVPVLISGTGAIFGLIRARLEIRSHAEIDYEILCLALLLFAMLTAYWQAKRGA